MKQHLVVAIVMVFIFWGFISDTALAQEPAVPQEATPVMAEEELETEFSYGTVKSISGDQLVVSEYDYDADQDIDVTYAVPPEAKLENVTSLQEIAAGDTVDIDFLVKDGQKIATLITVEKPIEEDEELMLDEAPAET